MTQIINQISRVSQNKVDNFLEKNPIKEGTLKNLNEILVSSEEKIGKIDFSEFFIEIDKIKESGKRIYKQLGKDEKSKIKIITYILDNINLIMSKINIREVYNNNPIIGYNDFKDLNYQEQIKKIKYSKEHFTQKNNSLDGQKTIGGDCNNWLLFIYNILYKDIMDSDNEIEVTFELEKQRHGRMYFKINNKIIEIHNPIRKIEFNLLTEEENKDRYNEKKKKIRETNMGYDSYLKELDKLNERKNLIKYIFMGKKIYLINFKGVKVILLLDNKLFSKSGSLKQYIKDNPIKFITENRKYSGISKKFKNNEELKEFLIKKVGNENFIKNFMKSVDLEKVKKLMGK